MSRWRGQFLRGELFSACISFVKDLVSCTHYCLLFISARFITSAPESNENTLLPDFRQLVNYPKYVTVGDKMRCVMCGELCHLEKRRKGGKNAQVIPPRNKGICSSCDMQAWQVVGSDLAMKFCYQCKKFQSWCAFGADGSLRHCDKCREYSREYHSKSVSPTPTESAEEPEMLDIEH